MSDKFKFSEEDRIEIENLAYDVYNLGSDNIIDRIESIIQDRGNSIQDGWIDVEEKMPLEHGYYYVYYSNEMDNGTIIALFRGSDFFHGSIYPMADVKFWQPLPSPPKQPKK